MEEFDKLEKPKVDDQEAEARFELSKTPEGREIRERLEKEYNNRITILKDVLAVLKIPEDLIILAPPVLDRTDFGYVSDIDLIFLGTIKQGEKLYQKLHASFEILPFIIYFSQERLLEIKNDFSEFYHFLMQRKGNIQAKESELEANKNYWSEAEELEIKARKILSPKEKLRLKEQRLKIGNSFVEEVKQRVMVLGHAFSGSMMTNIERFGINSDLDVDFLIDSAGEKSERDAIDWINVFLKWKYAEKFGVKIDASHTSLKFAREMVSHEPKFIDYYKKEFGVDIVENK